MKYNGKTGFLPCPSYTFNPVKLASDQNSKVVFEGVPREKEGQMANGSLCLEWLWHLERVPSGLQLP